MAQVKVNYGKRQPLADIESKLNGNLVKLHETTAFDRESQAHFSKERRRAFAALFTFAMSEPAEECRRQSEHVSRLIISLPESWQRPLGLSGQRLSMSPLRPTQYASVFTVYCGKFARSFILANVPTTCDYESIRG